MQAAHPQQRVWSASEIQIQLDKLQVLGSVLYFAAHPDDENTRLIAWLAQDKKYRTGYLSLTRGEGGQNLIGTDLGIDLGLIRTQELLSARAIDKGEQFFSSAYDFGFSKTHEETFKFWDKEQTLADAVYIIRKFRPDVIINRFPPDRRGGHGHHQASAILAREAFDAAADPNRFPEQLETVSPWQAKRLLWNTANFGGMNNTSDDQLKIDIGAYSPLLGQSYGEIAAKSRSQHQSQGFGAAASRGQSIEYFEHVAGEEATQDLMDRINTSWSRVGNGAKVQVLAKQISQKFDPKHPEHIVKDLFTLRKALEDIDDSYWKAEKIKDIEELILACSGIWLEATASRPEVVVNQPFDVHVEAIVRTTLSDVEVMAINDQSTQGKLAENKLWKATLPFSWSETTQPYWLVGDFSGGNYTLQQSDVGYPINVKKPHVNIVLRIGDEKLSLSRDVQFKSVDPVQGEVYRDLAMVPSLTAELSEQSLLFTDNNAKEVNVSFRNNDPNVARTTVSVELPYNWKVNPKQVELDFSAGNSVTKTLSVVPASTQPEQGSLKFIQNGEPLRAVRTLQYTHIPTLTRFPVTELALRHVELANPVQRIGYIHGAGDLVASSLSQIGIEVTSLADHQIQAEQLAQYDAVVVGIRFFNVNETSGTALAQLLRYAEEGGVVLVQYNVNSRLQVAQPGPYPFSLTRDRVTEEDAVPIFDPNDPIFNYPNKITKADFDGWVQERGLYFAVNIDPAYRTPLRMHDTGEEAHPGSLLIAPYGKGKFVYTSLSFFRQLPAGVPGAYRLFVNLLAKEK